MCKSAWLRESAQVSELLESVKFEEESILSIKHEVALREMQKVWMTGKFEILAMSLY